MPTAGYRIALRFALNIALRQGNHLETVKVPGICKCSWPSGDGAVMFRTILKLLTALTIGSLVSVSPVSLSVMSLSVMSVALAQQPAAAPQPPPPSQLAAPSQPSAAATAVPQAMPGTETPPAAVSEGAARALRAAMRGLHELSPWSMFLSADIVVKGVIIGLVFASLVTWTVLIAKTIELSALKGRLRKALPKAAEARPLP